MHLLNLLQIHKSIGSQMQDPVFSVRLAQLEVSVAVAVCSGSSWSFKLDFNT